MILDKTIFLCGFMGCGKTTVGRELAKRLSCRFVDLDELIVETDGRPIPDIFSQSGEGYFRELETKLIKEFDSGAVVALGGGAVLKKENTDAIKRIGVLVFIDTDFDICFGRISGDKNRPLAANSEREELLQRYNSRLPIYSSVGDMTVSGSGSPEDIASEILSRIYS